MSVTPAARPRSVAAHASAPPARPPAASTPVPTRGDSIQRSPAHGFGIGLLGAASAEAGIVAGAGATGSGGIGIFYGPGHGIRPGAFVSGGAFAGAGRETVAAPRTGEPSGALGAFAGAGIGVFMTNASSAADLRGVAPTYSLNVGEGLKFSAQLGFADGTFVGSVSLGPGIGLDASRYPTRTAAVSP